MIDRTVYARNKELVERLSSRNLTPFDLIPQIDLREKLVELVLNGVPEYADYESSVIFRELSKNLKNQTVDDVKVVVFGGGTGLSNIIGGDCRQQGWMNRPFEGLKELFPETKAVVCVTDDGGSTGELLKDLPVIALGDVRHVLLSSIQLQNLENVYHLTVGEAGQVVGVLSALFNYRFSGKQKSAEHLIKKSGADLSLLPPVIREYILSAVRLCFKHRSVLKTLDRPHCLGNLILLSELIKVLPENAFSSDSFQLSDEMAEQMYENISAVSRLIGAGEDAVLPSTVTPAQLRFLYTNGVQVTGEFKSSRTQRGYPVDRVFVDFCRSPYVSKRIINCINKADILIMAPGSLYSSIIPVLQVPGIASAVRANKTALKLLISNLWVQAGETDKSISDPERKFQISDMIKAYDRNLPGGTRGLFDHVLCLSLKDVPASVIQNYAIEGKIPIYLDRDQLKLQFFEAIECGFFSKTALLERQVIQHDPGVVAQTVKTLYLARKIIPELVQEKNEMVLEEKVQATSRLVPLPSVTYRQIKEIISKIPIETGTGADLAADSSGLRVVLADILWSHKDIPLSHLENIGGISCVHQEDWRRDQRWDNVFSFYDPLDKTIKIRSDRFSNIRKLEISFLIAVGQALLGNYVLEKKVEDIIVDSGAQGRVFHLFLRDSSERHCYFDDNELKQYLQMARMNKRTDDHFTRLINGHEGFTPPGLLFGVMYAWYLDNSFASYIEYKMSVLKVRQTDLIPEQIRTMQRRVELINFFRTTVFGKHYKLI